MEWTSGKNSNDSTYGFLCVEFVPMELTNVGVGGRWWRKLAVQKKPFPSLQRKKVDRKVVLSLAVTLFLPLLKQIHHHNNH
jgi:hypothetical protein